MRAALRRFLDGDLWHSFRTSPMAMLAVAETGFLGRVTAATGAVVAARAALAASVTARA